MKHIFIGLVLIFGWIHTLVGQTEADSIANLPVDMPRRFSWVLNRSFMLTDRMNDTVPINGNSSGTIFIGGGIRIPLVKQTVGLRLTPGVSWTNINYSQTNAKTFPTINANVQTEYTLERHGLTRVELPLGVYFNLTKDEDGDPRFFVEAGGYAGYLTAAGYKIKYKNPQGLRVKEKIRDLHKQNEKEFERLSYGIYARLGYKWISLYFQMRLSDVFDEFTNDDWNPTQKDGFKNPIIPSTQVGISVFL